MGSRCGTEPATPRLLILTGATASGKKGIARRLVASLNAEILAMDSMKVYRGMTIGTAKEVRGYVPVHLVDLVDPTESFSTGSYIEAARRTVEQIRARGHHPLFVGGTGLYLFALLRGFFDGPPADPAIRARLRDEARQGGVERLHQRLAEVDPATADRVGRRDARRIFRALEVHELTGQPISTLRAERTRPPIPGPAHVAGVRWPRSDLVERIDRRVLEMFEGGLLDECRRLLELGDLAPEPRMAIGYREAFAHLRGEISLTEAVESTRRATRRLARRQATWFRRFPEIRWADASPAHDPEVIAAAIRQALAGSD